MMSKIDNLSASQEQSNIEYTTIPDTPDYYPCRWGSYPETNNLYSDSKNHSYNIRWQNVRPLDRTRVTLEDPENKYGLREDSSSSDTDSGSYEGSDSVDDTFIEASWVNVGGERQVIVASAPIESRFHHWWTMISLKNVKEIYCLTREKEKNMTKMTLYWSLSVNTSVTFDPFVLTTKTVECISDDYVRYTVEVVCGKEKHTVTINHYTGWPDFGVPENVDEIADIVKDLTNAPDPVVLHCSAGRGRTGVVVSALRVLNTGETIPEAVETVRKDRTGMVQTGGQYYFLKKLVSELKVTSK